MNLSPSPEVIEASKLEGLLELPDWKAFLSFQSTNYCKILEQGRVLAFSSSQKDFEKGLVRGQIPIRDLCSVQVDHLDPKRFILVTKKGSYKFFAKSLDECLSWVDGLIILMSFAVEWDRKWQAYLKDLHPEIVIEEIESEFDPVSPSSKNHKLTFNPEEQLKSNQEYLKAKGYDTVLDHIDSQVLNSRLKMGILWRQCKGVAGREIIARRWCMLISSKPILHHQAEKEDEVTLRKGQIPLNIKFDTLYMFEDVCSRSGPVEVIKLEDVIQVIIKKKNEAEGLYHFILDFGDRKCNLFSSSFAEMDMWLRAIQATRANILETSQSLLPSLKNIFWILQIKDTKNGEENLKKKVEEDYEKLAIIEDDGRMESTQDFISVQEKVTNEFINIINACLVHRHHRIDIIKIYAEIFHERMLVSLRNYYKKNFEDFQNGDLFSIIKFLNSYQNNLAIFGSAFLDPRIKNGISILSRIAAQKVLKANIRALNNVLKSEVEDDPQFDSRGRLVTFHPKDVMRILNDSFNLLDFCNVGDFILQLLQASQQALEYFQQGLQNIIDHATHLTNEQLVGICNDGTVFLNEIKGFVNLTRSVTPFSPHIIAQNFNHKALNKTTVKLSSKALNTLSLKFFTNTLRTSKSSKTFLHINLIEMVERTLRNMEDILAKLHPIYMTKLRSSVLKQAVNYYIKSFLEAVDHKQVTKRNQVDIIARFSSIQFAFIESFKDLRDAAVQKILTPIAEFEDFLTRPYDLLTPGVQALKQYYGDSLHWQTMEGLIKLREQDLSRESQQQMLIMCREIFRVTEKVQKEKKLKVDQEEEEEKIDQSWEKIISSASYSSAFSASLEDPINIKTLPGKSSLEGNLIIESGFGVFSGLTGLKYFSIKNDHMYCFKNEVSELSLMSLNLQEAVDCKPDQEKNKFILIIKSKNGPAKELKFSADNESKRNIWVQNLISIINPALSPINKAPSRSQSFQKDVLSGNNIKIFKDESSLFPESEEQKPLKYDYNISKGLKATNVSSFSTMDLSTKASSIFRRPDLKMSAQGDFIEEDDFIGRFNYVEEPKIGFCAKFCMKLGLVEIKGMARDSDPNVQ